MSGRGSFEKISSTRDAWLYRSSSLTKAWSVPSGNDSPVKKRKNKGKRKRKTHSQVKVKQTDTLKADLCEEGTGKACPREVSRRTIHFLDLRFLFDYSSFERSPSS